MSPNQISLLVYLESRLVVQQGMINEKELSPEDMKTIITWHEIGIMHLKKLKPPARHPDPAFTHRVRFTKALYRLAWNARQAKAEQFSPTLKPSDPEEQGDDQSLHEEYTQFLAAHKAKATPVQNEVAKEILSVLEKKEYTFWLKNPATGTTWLLSTIDQFLTAIKTSKKPNQKNEK